MRPSKPRHPRAVPNVFPEHATDPEAEAPFAEGAGDELNPDLRHRLISEAKVHMRYTCSADIVTGMTWMIGCRPRPPATTCCCSVRRSRCRRSSARMGAHDPESDPRAAATAARKCPRRPLDGVGQALKKRLVR